ncbi:MAG: putative toxin-antitoxin system toxin component, PIN family [Erysipelotrichaceae bacterium]
MKYYAVIDTNVVVLAALKWKSVPGSIIDLAFNGVIVPLINEEILGEYREVLLRPKFHLNEEIVNNIVETFVRQGLYVYKEQLEIEIPDPKDRVFYEVTMKARKEEDAYLVTGNIKHFPIKPFIVSPREMFDIILSENSYYEE